MQQQTDSAADSLRRKREQYECEDVLKDDNDEAPDPGRLLSIQKMQSAKRRRQERNTVDTRKDRELSRSVSDSSLVTAMPPQLARHDSERPKTSTSASTRQKPPLDSRRTFAGAPSEPMADVILSTRNERKDIGKRKRDTGGPPVPDEQKIFMGLRFYFFPNSDKNKARKARIEVAKKYGAVWEQDLDETATHVIIDNGLDFASFRRFTKVESLPSSLIVVNEKYPSDCLTFKKLLDPRQPEFKVKGYDTSATLISGQSTSESSLQLHPAGPEVQTRLPETPVEQSRVAPPPPLRPINQDEPAQEPPTATTANSSSMGFIHSTAEFDAVIKQARDLQHVPLDDDDEAGSRPTSSGGPETDDEGEIGGFKLIKHKKNKTKRMQDTFQCMKEHTGSNESPNVATIAILQQMADYYDQIGDEWRPRAYRKAISALRNHPTKVWTREEALALPQIGERLATKIEEIAYTNRLRRLDNAIAEPSDQILRTFMQVYGAGPAQASKWVNAGYKTLYELREKATLTENQKIGIDHYEDFNSRIPRAEVAKHGGIVRATLQAIDPAFEVIVGGSYRRGAESSGDIDCMITRPDTGMEHIRSVVVNQLIPQLFAQDFLVAELAVTSHDDGSKWHGASHIASRSHANPWRRIDLLLVPSDELGAALIYFTGNDIFNRSLRLLASTKGMRLNQRGLYKDVMRGKGRERLSEGTLVEGKDEKKIFEALGVPWRPPEHRIC